MSRQSFPLVGFGSMLFAILSYKSRPTRLVLEIRPSHQVYYDSNPVTMTSIIMKNSDDDLQEDCLLRCKECCLLLLLFMADVLAHRLVHSVLRNTNASVHIAVPLMHAKTFLCLLTVILDPSTELYKVGYRSPANLVEPTSFASVPRMGLVCLVCLNL